VQTSLVAGTLELGLVFLRRLVDGERVALEECQYRGFWSSQVSVAERRDTRQHQEQRSIFELGQLITKQIQ
jgi:hypothetical protein